MMRRALRRWQTLALAGLVLISLMQAAGLRSRGIHNNDFKHLWLGAKILAEGASPYDPRIMGIGARQYGFGTINPFVYPPSTGLMLRPFAGLSFERAEAAWFWMNWVLAWLCVLAGPWFLKVPRPGPARWAGALYLAGSLPFYRQMTAGQMNVVLLAALILSVGLLIRRRDTGAGIILGFAAAFKVTPIFLVLVLWRMRRRRAVAASVIALASVMLAAAVWAGLGTHIEAFSVMRQMGYGSGTWEDFYRQPFNQSFNSLFHHLFAANPYTQPWVDLGPRVANGLTWLASVAMLVAGWRMLARYRRRPYFKTQWGDVETSLFLAAGLVMLLLPSLMWDHYAVQCLAALMWVCGSDRPGRGLLAGGLTAIGAVAVFFLLAYPWLHGADRWSHGWGIPLMSIRLWGTLGLLMLVRAGWRESMKGRLAEASRSARNRS